jgi:hypothetical protein
LIATPEAERDMDTARIVREAVIDAITDPAPTGSTRTGDDVVASAITLRAALPDLKVLSASESQLLGDWLDRIIDG